MSRRRRRSRLLLGLIVIALIEGALQLAGPLVQSAMRRQDGPPSPDAPLTVLCVGDSNTYGLHLPRVYAYPSFLEASLSARYRLPVTVINRGVPGQNTAQVAHGLIQDLGDVQPDVVLILAGINDTWNTDREGGGLLAWLGRLKLVRLFRVLSAGVTTAGQFEVDTDASGEIVVDRGDGQRRVNAGTDAVITRDDDELTASLRAGLGKALDTCRDFGAVPVLMTYVEFQGVFARVNAAIRQFAEDAGVPLVDHERGFAAHFEEHGYERLMFTDQHPNQTGYRLMAAGIAEGLTDAGLVPEVVLAGEGGAAELADPPFLPRVRVADGRIVIEGPQGWAWQALISEAPEGPDDGFDIGSARVPLRPGDLLGKSRHEPTFSGRFTTEATTLRLPTVIREAAQGPLALCLLLLRDVPVGGSHAQAPAIAAVAGPFSLTDG